MFQSLNFKKILPLTAACLMVSCGAYAGKSEDIGQGDISTSTKRKLEGFGSSPKKQKTDGFEGYIDKTEDTESQSEEDSIRIANANFGPVFSEILPLLGAYFSSHKLLDMRLIDKDCNEISAQLWKQRDPNVNFTQVWQGGPTSETFYNSVINYVVHNFLLNCWTNRKVNDFHTTERFKYYDEKLKEIFFGSLAIKNQYDLVNIYNLLAEFGGLRGRPVKFYKTFFEKDNVKSLVKQGDAEKRLFHFFKFTGGLKFAKKSPFHAAPKLGEPKTLVELLSEEVALRKQIEETQEAEELRFYNRLFDTGVNIQPSDYCDAFDLALSFKQYGELARYSEGIFTHPDSATSELREYGHKLLTLKQYEQAAAHFEAVLNRADATTQDYRNAAWSYYNAKDYLRAAEYYETILKRPGATTNDYRNAAWSYYCAKDYLRAAEYYETILKRPDATTQDYRNAGHTRSQAQQYEQAAAHFEAVLSRADATIQDCRAAGGMRRLTGDYARAAVHFEAILNHPNATTQYCL
jgi:tetratricopeptide (TPR) repeat protein